MLAVIWMPATEVLLDSTAWPSERAWWTERTQSQNSCVAY